MIFIVQIQQDNWVSQDQPNLLLKKQTKEEEKIKKFIQTNKRRTRNKNFLQYSFYQLEKTAGCKNWRPSWGRWVLKQLLNNFLL